MKIRRAITTRLSVVTAWIATRYHWHATKLSRNTVFVWYEALAAGSTEEYDKLCSALGVPCTDADITAVQEASAPKTLRGQGIGLHNIRSAGQTTFRDHGLPASVLAYMTDVLMSGLPQVLRESWNVSALDSEAASSGS
jgi:hypothetical protein